LGDLDIDGRIVLLLILKKYDMRKWARLIWLRIRSGGIPCEHGSDTSGSTEIREFLESLRDY
jgi:hypothetical protein